MNNIFIIAAVVSSIFLIAKIIEFRFIEKEEKENKPFKLLVRDALIVYFSVVSGYFLFEQFKSNELGETTKVTPVFIDNPGF